MLKTLNNSGGKHGTWIRVVSEENPDNSLCYNELMGHIHTVGGIGMAFALDTRVPEDG